jgi:hypothetical protein
MIRIASARLAVLTVIAVFLTVVVPSHGVAAQGANHPGVLPPGSQYGKTFGQWGAAWWQWALGQPAATSPLVDPTGANCSVGQLGSVWFLAGNFGGTDVRSCTIPANTAVFFPVANAFSCTDPGGTASFGQNRVVSRSSLKDARNLRAEVDGVAIQQLQRYQAHSTNFNIVLPNDNIFGVPAGVCTNAAADGIYIMLAPFTPGAHTIHFHAEFTGGPTDVTYNLTVSP